MHVSEHRMNRTVKKNFGWQVKRKNCPFPIGWTDLVDWGGKREPKEKEEEVKG